MWVELDADSFDEVLSSYLRKCIDNIDMDNSELFEGDDKKKLLDAMKMTHDWFSKPKDWFYK